MNLTIAYCSNRNESKFKWFRDSLMKECDLNWKHISGSKIHIICIVPETEHQTIYSEFPSYFNGKENVCSFEIITTVTYSKPTFWSGSSRLTKEDWWSKSNSLNTALALCKTDWFSTMDDRSVVLPGYLDGIRAAISGNYCVLGTYEKRVSMTVESGIIKNAGVIVGKDDRLTYAQEHYIKHGHKPPFKSPGGWCYGVSITLPTEWALQVNGWPESCDSLGMEDVMFGCFLQNNGFDIRFDPSMRVVEDRTVGECNPVAKRSDFGVSPNDWSHKLKAELEVLKQAPNGYSIRDLRNDMISGKQWPMPTGPKFHPWQQTPLSEL